MWCEDVLWNFLAFSIIVRDCLFSIRCAASSSSRHDVVQDCKKAGSKNYHHADHHHHHQLVFSHIISEFSSDRRAGPQAVLRVVTSLDHLSQSAK